MESGREVVCEENQKQPGQKVDQDSVQAPKTTVCQELGTMWERGWETRRPMMAGSGLRGQVA